MGVAQQFDYEGLQHSEVCSGDQIEQSLHILHIDFLVPDGLQLMYDQILHLLLRNTEKLLALLQNNNLMHVIPIILLVAVLLNPLDHGPVVMVLRVLL